MKNLLLIFTIGLLVTACKKSIVTDNEIPGWLQQKIAESEATIKTESKSMLEVSAWYRYEFKGNTYYEYVNPTLATALNLYDASGNRQQNLTTDFIMDYLAGKTNKLIVWSGPKFKDFRAENGATETIQTTWVNALEEQTGDGELVYRPATYREFPVLRFRHQFIFNEAGVGKTLVLSPTDAHYFASCTWSYNIDTRILEVKIEGQGSPKFLVTALRGDILKLKRL